MAEMRFHYFANCTNMGSVKAWGVVCGSCVFVYFFVNEDS